MRNNYNDDEQNNNELSDTNEESRIRYVIYENDDNKKDTVDCEVDKEKKSSLITKDKNENKEEILKSKSHVSELVKDANNCLKTKDQNNATKDTIISSNKKTESMKIKYTDDDDVIQQLKLRIKKELTHNNDVTENPSLPRGETLETVTVMSKKYLGEELAKILASINDKNDSVADMEKRIKAIKAVANNWVDDFIDLAAHHQSDREIHDTLKYMLFSGYGMDQDDNDKLKYIREIVRDSKSLHSLVDSGQTTLTVLPVTQNSVGENPK